MVLRKYNERVLEAVEEGFVDPSYVLQAALAWMNDNEIKQMCLANDILIFDEECEE